MDYISKSPRKQNPMLPMLLTDEEGTVWRYNRVAFVADDFHPAYMREDNARIERFAETRDNKVQLMSEEAHNAIKNREIPKREPAVKPNPTDGFRL
ncbi:MAG: hypothetical protein LBL34_05430 [Clostridiales bacterium]|jgi:hypothetical protein|nr:hypothetical protein [Clostridiales bacterium]